MPIELPDLIVPDAPAWREWLEANVGVPGMRLLLANKGTTQPTSLRYDDALREALCFGWIDGQVNSRDAGTHWQRFTPRRPRSPWSKRNVGFVEQLVVEGRMREAGLAEVERARADGRWDAAYAGPATIEVPAELTAALSRDPAAAAMFEILTSQNRYAILYRLQSAKRPETRARRLEQFVALLARGETHYPQRRTLDTE